MTTWTNDELDTIGDADGLRIAALRTDGTLRNPVTILVVRKDNELYVRSVKGAVAGWYRGHAGDPRGARAGGRGRQGRYFVDVDRGLTGRSTTPTGPSTAASAAATSTRWWRPRPRPPRSSWCRARKGPQTGSGGLVGDPDVEDRPGGFD